MKVTLKQIKDYFKSEFKWLDSISIGKIDNGQEKAICFYNSKRSLAYQNVVGGSINKSTYIKPITILKIKIVLRKKHRKFMSSLKEELFLLKVNEYLFKCITKNLSI